MSEELKPANPHPLFGVTCSHGTLRRKCYICELEDDLSLERQRSAVLVEALNDIKDHSGIPTFTGEKWSNYCHVVAFEVLKRYEEMGK